MRSSTYGFHHFREALFEEMVIMVVWHLKSVENHQHSRNRKPGVRRTMGNV
jgi:hypothetical protein